MKGIFNNPKLKTACSWTLCGIILAVAVATLVFYIAGPSIGYIHSDCADSLLWSLASAETGDVFAEDFHYAALLPFGAPVWTVPLIWIFGFSITTYTISMSIFAILLIASAFSLFRAIKCTPTISALFSFCFAMLLSGSAKLREIMWEHTIYYSLALLFILLLLNVCFRLIPYITAWDRGQTNRKQYTQLVVWAILLILLCAGCATDGMQILVISVLPVLGAWLAHTVLDSQKLLSRESVNRYVLCGLMALGVLFGLILLRFFTNNGAITAGYEDAYSTWSALDTWSENAKVIPAQYFSLFGIPHGMNGPLFTLDSVPIIFKIFCALILQICPIVLLCRYKAIRHTSSKIVLWTHLATSFVILFGMICGSLSSAEWRLVPLLGTAILATLVFLREMFSDTIVAKRICVLLAAVIVAVSAFHAYEICSMPQDHGQNRDHAVLAQMLEDKGYDYGYATFWNCHITRLLSDDHVLTLPVEIVGDRVQIYQHQLRDSWIQQRDNQSCFLLLSRYEYATLLPTEYWGELTANRQLIESFEHGDYCVFVFNGSVIL